MLVVSLSEFLPDLSVSLKPDSSLCFIPEALIAGDLQGSGCMNRPSSRLMRYTSGDDPQTSSSAVKGADRHMSEDEFSYK